MGTVSAENHSVCQAPAAELIQPARTAGSTPAEAVRESQSRQDVQLLHSLCPGRWSRCSACPEETGLTHALRVEGCWPYTAGGPRPGCTIKLRGPARTIIRQAGASDMRCWLGQDGQSGGAAARCPGLSRSSYRPPMPGWLSWMGSCNPHRPRTTQRLPRPGDRKAQDSEPTLCSKGWSVRTRPSWRHSCSAGQPAGCPAQLEAQLYSAQAVQSNLPAPQAVVAEPEGLVHAVHQQLRGRALCRTQLWEKDAQLAMSPVAAGSRLAAMVQDNGSQVEVASWASCVTNGSPGSTCCSPRWGSSPCCNGCPFATLQAAT